MKKTILAAAIAGTLLTQSGVQAIEQAPPPLPHQQKAAIPPAPQSTAMLTIFSASNEVQQALKPQADLAKKLDLYTKFEFSPELRPKLAELFGAEHPFPMLRAAGAKGQLTYTAKLKKFTYLGADGTVAMWDDLNAKIVTNKAGNALNFTSAWPSLSISGPQATVVLDKMSFDGKQSRGADGVWYGAASAKMGSLALFAGPSRREGKEVFRMDDMQVRAEQIRRGKKAEVLYGWSTKAIVANGEKIDHANIGVRLVNVPTQTLANFDQELRNEGASQLAPAAQHEVMMRTLTRFGKELVTGGASVVIDDISASYRGNIASIKGRFDFDKMVEADFLDPVAFGKKIIARLDLRLPVALVNDVSHLVAEKQAIATPQKTAAQIDADAKTIADVVIGKLVNEGYAVMGKGELRSAIDIRNGKVSFNGKIIPLPGSPDGDLVKVYGGVHIGTPPTRVPPPAPVPAAPVR